MDLNPRDPSSSLPNKPSTPPSAPPVEGNGSPQLPIEPIVKPTETTGTPASAPVVSQPVVTEPKPLSAPAITQSSAESPKSEDTEDSEAGISPSTLPGDTATQNTSSEPSDPVKAPDNLSQPKTEPVSDRPDDSESVKIPDTAKAIPQGIEETHDHHHDHHTEAIKPETVLAEAGQQIGHSPEAGGEGHATNKTKLLIVLAILVLLLGVGGGLFGMLMSNNKSDTSNGEPVKLKVGVMMAFSGGSSSMGYGAMKGINLAKKQLNATNIDIVQMDSKCDAKSAASAIKQLIAQKVVAIIGEGCSSATVAALPAANNAKVVMISPSASSPTLSIPNDYFFRVVPPDTLQGSFMANHIYNKGLRNAAVFYTDEPYGSGMNQVFREKFEALGGKIVTTASAEPDVIDLDTQVKTLKDAKPQAIFIAPNSVVSATAIIKLLRGAGVTAPLYGADIMYDTTIIQNGGTAAEGLTISSFPTGTKSFKQALTNENKKTEQLYAAPQAYDIIHVLQMAAEKGARSGEDIKNALPSISFDGVSGPISFDQNGEVSNKDYKYDLFQVKGSEFIVQE